MLSSILPDEIMEEILSRLPAKSLIQLKLVSKSWRELIATDRQFMVTHRKTRASISYNSCVLLMKWHGKNSSVVTNYNPLYTIVTCESYPQLVTSAIDVNPGAKILENEKPKYVSVVSECDGIFCAHFDFRDVFVWNPSIRDLKALPKCSPTHPELPESAIYIYACFGLGFDHKSDDYKVVRVWSFYDTGVRTRCNAHVEVCTLSSHSWREIDAVPQTTIIVKDIRPISIKGRCYWNGYLPNDILVWFDMTDEVFQEIKLPNPLSAKILENRLLELGELKESLALFSIAVQARKINSFEVWLLDEKLHGDNTISGNQSQFTWCKYASIQTDRPKLFPVGFCTKGALILLHEWKKVVVYESDTKKTVDSGVAREALEQIFVYSESLVSIN